MFDDLFGTDAATAATDEQAWVRAMLEVEASLARACAAAGLIHADAATAIADACRIDLVDPARVWRSAVASATPVIAVVDALREALPAPHRPSVHFGATSQDIVDTAMMLIAKRTIDGLLVDLAAARNRLARLEADHRTSAQLGRTLMRPARPTTFGATCAAWHRALEAADAGLRRWRPAVQLGGAVGDRAAFAGHGDRVAAVLADDLGIDAAPPWHTDRTRVAGLGAALGICAGTLGKIAGDVILLSQAEIAELDEGSAAGSSAMPGKRNPARAILVVACAHRVPGLVTTLLAGMPQELHRAAGRWQAEWPVLTDLLRLVAGAAHHGRAMLAGLTVDADRMASRA